MSLGTIFAKSLVLTNPDGSTASSQGIRRSNVGVVDLDIDFSRGKDPQVFDETASGTGSATVTAAGQVCLNTFQAGDRAVYQSLNYMAAPGGTCKVARLSLQCSQTLTAADSGVRLRWGLFDCAADKGSVIPQQSESGLFFELYSGVFSVVRRESTSQQDEIITQTSFNGYRAVVIDWTAAEVFTVEMDSSGALCRMGILRSGQDIPLHTFTNSAVHMSTAQPVRFELEQVSGSATAATAVLRNSSVCFEGPQAGALPLYSKGLGAVPRVVGPTRTHVLSIQLPPGVHTPVNLKQVQVMAQGPVFWEVIVHGTVSVDAMWVQSGTTQTDTAASSVAGGYVTQAWYSSTNETATIELGRLSLASTISGTALPITLACTSLTGSPTLAFATWTFLNG